VSDPRDDQPVDPLLALQAQIDQMAALAPELARAAKSIFDAFQGEGFTSQQALYLTMAQVLEDPGSAP